jgi:hypothetical protein
MSQPDPTTAAYRAWMRHIGHNDDGERCEECASTDAPTMGCGEGRRLWSAYRLSRIASAIPVTDGS